MIKQLNNIKYVYTFKICLQKIRNKTNQRFIDVVSSFGFRWFRYTNNDWRITITVYR